MAFRRKNARHSRSSGVRRLPHRPPVPRAWKDRALHLAREIRLLPYFSLAGSIALILLTISFIRFAVYSDYFSVKEVAVAGNTRLTQDALLEFLATDTGVESGVSMMSIQPGNMEQRLQSLPEVRAAMVKREWPDIVRVDITEHVPEGLYISQNGSFVFDREGLIFAEATTPDFLDTSLILLTGLENTLLEKGSEIPAPVLARAREYQRVFSTAAPQIAADISEIHFDEKTGLSLVFHDGSRFLCGDRRPEEVGPMIESLLAERRRIAPRIDSANLYSDQYLTVAQSAPGEREVADGNRHRN